MGTDARVGCAVRVSFPGPVRAHMTHFRSPHYRLHFPYQTHNLTAPSDIVQPAPPVSCPPFGAIYTNRPAE